jgi:RNA polymerase sigma factor (sigma-70 family)
LTYFKELAKTNAEKTLDQEELTPLFSKVSYLMNDCIKQMIQETTILQYNIIDLGAELLANIDRNKAIFNRNVGYDSKDKFVDIPVKNKTKLQENMLCKCMDLQKAILKNNNKQQLTIFNSIPLNRLQYEPTIYIWLNKIKEYKEAVDRQLKAFATENIDDYIKESNEVYNLENKLGIRPDSSYQLYNFVYKRMKAVSTIYNSIVKAYARSVLKKANDRAGTGNQVLDYYQNGNFGLLRAVRSYDHVSNVRFSGHAEWWVKQSMLLLMKEETNIIKLSTNTWQHHSKLEKIRLRIEASNGCASYANIAKESGYTEAQVEEVFSNVKTSQVKSLEYKLSSEGFTLLTVASGSDDPIIIEDATKASEGIIVSEEESNEDEKQIAVKELLGALDETSRKIVCLSYGIVDQKNQNIDPEKVRLERVRQAIAFNLRTKN